MNEAAELETLKRDIDVRQFATSLGYEIDKRDSWRGSEAGRTDLIFKVGLPAEDGADWNQILQQRLPSSSHLIGTEEANMTEILSKTA